MTHQPTQLNRPWLSSFAFASAFTDDRAAQIHKLARNFAVSLDLGCPSVNHVSGHTELTVQEHDELDERGRYLLWVRQWKAIYSELSEYIRLLKKMRKTVNFPRNDPRLEKTLRKATVDELNWFAHRQLPKMAETAQALLNARYVGKLAYKALVMEKILVEMEHAENARLAEIAGQPNALLDDLSYQEVGAHDYPLTAPVIR